MMMDLLEGANLNSWTPKSRLSVQCIRRFSVFPNHYSITFSYEDDSVYYQGSLVIQLQWNLDL
jgi:hypothetical protein